MVSYLKAEQLKFRRTFMQKLIFIAPVVPLLLAAALALYWFQVTAFNWWYVLLLQGYISVMAGLADLKESKKMGYRAIWGLPVSLRKVWIAKNILYIIYMSVSCLILFLGVVIGGFFVPDLLTIWRAGMGTLFIIITSLWQIPFCMFISKKIGMVGAFFMHVGMGMFLGILLSTEKIWWVCPYCWTLRIMTPILGILPNGILAEAGNPMLDWSSVPAATVLSLVLFAGLLLITANWFQKQEVK